MKLGLKVGLLGVILILSMQSFPTAAADPLDSWTLRPTGFDLRTGKVRYDGSQFLICTPDGGSVLTAADGTNWTKRDIGGNSSTDICLGAQGWVATSYGAAFHLSTNLVDWTTCFPSGGDFSSSSRKGIAYGNGMYVSAGLYNHYGPGGSMVVSSNALDWFDPGSPGLDMNAIHFGNGLFVAVGGDNGPRVMTSPDGLQWTIFTPVTGELHDVCSSPGRFVAVGYEFLSFPNIVGISAVSLDGTNWPYSPPTISALTNRTLGSVAYGAGVFVAVGGGTIATSTDGYAWKLRTNAPARGVGWHSVAYGQGTFLVTDGSTNVMQSASVLPRLAIGNGTPPNIQLSGVAGVTYQIESKDSLSESNWVSIATLSMTNSVVSWMDSRNDGAVQRYYRASVVEP